MELPIAVRDALDTLIAASGFTTAALRDAAEKMTVSYKEASGRGARLVTERCAALAYAAARMPATYGAVCSALSGALQTLSDGDISSLTTVLDLGAGTGASVLAAAACLPCGGALSVTAVEREREMLSVGCALTQDCPVTWVQDDAVSYARRLISEGTRYDVVIASYMTNEMSSEDRLSFLNLLWSVTGKLLVLIEPGTKVGSAILREAKQQLSPDSATVCAPCPAIAGCPLDDDDWCHFTCRVARSRLHKALKGGDVPYEDEKFSYLALTALPHRNTCARVLRHPQKDAGRISVVLCTPDGRQSKTVTKRDKTAFARARKAGAGDTLDSEDSL